MPNLDSDGLALLQTIFGGIALLAIILAVAAVCTERVRRVRENDERHPTTKGVLMGCFANEPLGAIESLLGHHAPVLTLPSLEGLIEVADRGHWTSTTLDHMPELHSELTWMPLYESVFDDLKYVRDKLPDCGKGRKQIARVFERMNLAADKDPIKIMATAQYPFRNWVRQHFGRQSANLHAGHRLAELVDHRRGLYRDGKLRKCIRQLPKWSVPAKYERNDEPKGLAKVKPTWIVGKRPCIPVTREEVVALALMMGMPLTKSDNGLHYSGIGGYGLSLDLTHTEATWKLSVVKGSRIPRHAPSMGSGYTSLMAKHLACGNIPFAESPDWVRSVYVTDDVLDAIKHGVCVKDTHAYGGHSLEFLRRLPGEKQVDAYYGKADESHMHNTGSILNHDCKIVVGDWAHAVTGIAFGGLVPQAAPNIAEAVQFTVAGKAEDCVHHLEVLVDKLHKADPQSKLFGERVARRNEALGHTYVNHIHPDSERNSRDAASTFSRYMNLLERVAARCEVQDINHIFEEAAKHLQGVYQAVVKREGLHNQQPAGTLSLSPEEVNLVDQDIGAALSDITKGLRDDTKITLGNTSTIIRGILAAWARTVPRIDTREFVLGGPDSTPKENGVKVVFMDALPSVMALA